MTIRTPSLTATTRTDASRMRAEQTCARLQSCTENQRQWDGHTRWKRKGHERLTAREERRGASRIRLRRIRRPRSPRPTKTAAAQDERVTGWWWCRYPLAPLTATRQNSAFDQTNARAAHREAHCTHPLPPFPPSPLPKGRRWKMRSSRRSSLPYVLHSVLGLQSGAGIPRPLVRRLHQRRCAHFPYLLHRGPLRRIRRKQATHHCRCGLAIAT